MTDEEKLEAEEQTRIAEKKEKADAEAKELQHLKDIGVVDEDGVPWKNRAKEAERKREISQAKLDEIPITLVPVIPPPEEDEWTKQQREIARQEYQREAQATSTMKEILNRLEITSPLIKKYRGTIETRLVSMSWNLRQSSSAVEMVAEAILGKNIESILHDRPVAEQEPASNRRLVNVSSEVATPTPGGGEPTKIELTAEETEFADEKRLWDKFNDSEIREMYKKRQAKLGGKK